jgi:hypothetical protein
MVILQNDNLLYFSLWYPFFGRRGGHIKAIGWTKYSRGMLVYTVLSLCFLIFAMLLMIPSLYNENLFNVLSGSMFLVAFVRLFRIGKHHNIIISKCDSVRLAPLIAWIDNISFFASISLILFLADRQIALEEPSSVLALLLEMGVLVTMSIIIVFLTNALFFFLGVGRKPISL